MHPIQDGGQDGTPGQPRTTLRRGRPASDRTRPPAPPGHGRIHPQRPYVRVPRAGRGHRHDHPKAAPPCGLPCAFISRRDRCPAGPVPGPRTRNEQGDHAQEGRPSDCRRDVRHAARPIRQPGQGTDAGEPYQASRRRLARRASSSRRSSRPLRRSRFRRRPRTSRPRSPGRSPRPAARPSADTSCRRPTPTRWSGIRLGPYQASHVHLPGRRRHADALRLGQGSQQQGLGR